MRRRTIIIVSALGVAAITAALFFSLQSHSPRAARQTAAARATPRQGPIARLLAEEADMREASRAAAKAASLRAERQQLLKRTAAVQRQAKNLRAARARRASARSRTAEPGASTSAPKHEAARAPTSRRRTHAHKPKRSAHKGSEGEGSGNSTREARTEIRETERAEREVAREERREQH